MKTLLPEGKFTVTPSPVNPKNFYLDLVKPDGKKMTVLFDQNEKRLQAIADHLNAVISGEFDPTKIKRK